MSALAFKPDYQVEKVGSPPRGMTRRHRPLTASSTTTDAVSLRLFGDLISEPLDTDHRGKWLRYFLRVMYGADYVRRGARMLGIAETDLSRRMQTGLRVSRGVMERVAEVYPRRMRRRREELRKLAETIREAFEREAMALDSVPLIVRRLSVMASVAANTRQPHSVETGRFVPRVQGKLPALTEPRRKNNRSR
jgi:hypothetical protein